MAERDGGQRAAVTTPPALTSASAPARGLPRVHPALRWPLAAFKWLAGLLILGLLGNILLLLVSVGPSRFWASAYGQVAYVAGLIAANILAAAAIGVALLVVLGLSVLAEMQFKEERRQLRVARESQRAEEAAREALNKDGAAIADQVASAVEQRMRAAAAAGAAIVASAPALASGVISPAMLPRIGRLYGRDKQLDDALASLRAGSSLTVSAVNGLPGVGKTVFAAELVARAGERGLFPGGAAWISCEEREGAAGLDAIFAEVARALGQDGIAEMNDLARRRAALYAALHAPEAPAALLALDNVEPGLDDTALLDTLAGGRVTLLLTSRQHITDPRVSAFPLEELADAPARDLFRERLRQRDRTRPNAADEPLIPTVVAAVGGLPLALDLTAARAALLHQPLDQTAREAEADGLTGLTARIDRSWAALTAPQRLLLAGLSLVEGASFPRGVALALSTAAESLSASAPGTPTDGDATKDERARLTLDALVGLALVEALADERLRLHPTIRQYAGAQLERQPAEMQEALGEAAAGWWLTFAEAHPGFEGMDALEAEAAGLMGAITWARDHEQYRLLLDLVYALNDAWYVRGRRADERRFRPWAVGAARALDSTRDLRFMTHELALLDARAGRVEQARAGYEEALRLAQELGDKSAIQTETHSLAVLDRQVGRVEQARAGYEEALRLAQELGDKSAIQTETHELALLDADAGRVEQARAGYEEALRLAQELGDKSAIQTETHSLAVLDRQVGRVEQARAGYEEALRLARELGDKSAIQRETHELAVLDADAGRVEQARAGYEEALRLAQELGDKSAIRSETHSLAVLDADAGRVEQARAGFAEALRLARELGDKSAIRSETHSLAVLDRQVGRVEQARAGFAEALRLARELGDPVAAAAALRQLGIMDLQAGDIVAARRQLSEAQRLAESAQDAKSTVEAIWWLAELERLHGDRDAACAGFRRALAIYERIGDPNAEITRQRLRELGCEP